MCVCVCLCLCVLVHVRLMGVYGSMEHMQVYGYPHLQREFASADKHIVDECIRVSCRSSDNQHSSIPPEYSINRTIRGEQIIGKLNFR